MLAAISKFLYLQLVQNVCLCFTDFQYEIIKVGTTGKSVIMYQNYTFSYQGPKNVKLYPYCSKKNSTKCPARLKLDKEGNIIYAITEHNHPPPKYTRASGGLYIKID
ncbi:unnamed protein product [Parnassius mnemosyne]|uniref:FLYWCH-type domain-containing protein n=1 Tax=Parnassius mnemosyne TaxID=213953 RepID=A0AAV1K8G2_9NEOP